MQTTNTTMASEDTFDFYCDSPHRRVDFVVYAPMTLEIWMAAAKRQIWAGAWRQGALFNLLEAVDVPLLASGDETVALEDELQRKLGIRGPIAFLVAESVYEQTRDAAIAMSNRLPFSLELFTDIELAHLWLEGATRRSGS